MMPLRCRWRKPKTSRDEPDPPWQDGTLLQFVCDQEGFIHGIIADVPTGTLSRANYDRIQLVRTDGGATEPEPQQ